MYDLSIDVNDLFNCGDIEELLNDSSKQLQLYWDYLLNQLKVDLKYSQSNSHELSEELKKKLEKETEEVNNQFKLPIAGFKTPMGKNILTNKLTGLTGEKRLPSKRKLQDSENLMKSGIKKIRSNEDPLERLVSGKDNIFYSVNGSPIENPFFKETPFRRKLIVSAVKSVKRNRFV